MKYYIQTKYESFPTYWDHVENGDFDNIDLAMEAMTELHEKLGWCPLRIIDETGSCHDIIEVNND